MGVIVQSMATAFFSSAYHSTAGQALESRFADTLSISGVVARGSSRVAVDLAAAVDAVETGPGVVAGVWAVFAREASLFGEGKRWGRMVSA